MNIINIILFNFIFVLFFFWNRLSLLCIEFSYNFFYDLFSDTRRKVNLPRERRVCASSAAIILPFSSLSQSFRHSRKSSKLPCSLSFFTWLKMGRNSSTFSFFSSKNQQYLYIIHSIRRGLVLLCYCMFYLLFFLVPPSFSTVARVGFKLRARSMSPRLTASTVPFPSKSQIEKTKFAPEENNKKYKLKFI